MKVEIDNKKMWESLMDSLRTIGSQTSDELYADLTIALKNQGLAFDIKSKEIVEINIEPKFKKGDSVLWDGEMFKVLEVDTYRQQYNLGGYIVMFCDQDKMQLTTDRKSEFTESEDEKIRKALIKYFSEGMEYLSLIPYNKEQCVAWLEKQGEHANFRNKIQIGDKVTRNEDGMLVNLSQLNRVAKNEKQGEQKSADKVEPKFKAGDKIISTISNIPYYITEVCKGHYLTDVGCIIMFNAQDNFELVEQKPAWSEEDEKMYNVVHDLAWESYKTSRRLDIPTFGIINDWLKSLKDRVLPQPQQEWSEEDEYNAAFIIETLLGLDGDKEYSSKYKKMANWLKSLRPQNRWKPSKEQINALSITVKHGCTDDKEALGELLEQLKAL